MQLSWPMRLDCQTRPDSGQGWPAVSAGTLAKMRWPARPLASQSDPRVSVVVVRFSFVWLKKSRHGIC